MNNADLEKQIAVHRSLSSAERARQKLERDTQTFLAAGKQITVVPRGMGQGSPIIDSPEGRRAQWIMSEGKRKPQRRASQ